MAVVTVVGYRVVRSVPGEREGDQLQSDGPCVEDVEILSWARGAHLLGTEGQGSCAVPGHGPSLKLEGSYVHSAGDHPWVAVEIGRRQRDRRGVVSPVNCWRSGLQVVVVNCGIHEQRIRRDVSVLACLIRAYPAVWRCPGGEDIVVDEIGGHSIVEIPAKRGNNARRSNNQIVLKDCVRIEAIGKDARALSGGVVGDGVV